MALPRFAVPRKVAASPKVSVPSERLMSISRRQALVSKAYANALKSFLTSMEVDLVSTDQALFIADSRGFGIPSPLAHEAYVNSKVFTVADTIQRGSSPTFRQDGRSYFTTLSSYVSWVELHSIEAPSADARRAQEGYIQAKKNAKEEFEKATELYKHAKESDPAGVSTLDAWIQGEHGQSFREAQQDETKYSILWKQFQDPVMSEVVKAREILDAANDKSVYKLGATMPVTLKNRTSEVTEQPAQIDILYQPSYVLSNFDTIVKEWVANSKLDKAQLRTIPLDLDKAKHTSWSDFGFPWLDDATISVPDRAKAEAEVRADKTSGGQGVSNTQSSIDSISQTTGAVNLISGDKSIEQPKVDLSVIDLEDVSIKLVVGGIQAFDVARGLWNIANFREILPHLQSNAPGYLSRRFFKTTKVLLAYDVDVVVEVPDSVSAKLAKGGKVDIKSDILGALPVTVDLDGKLHTQTQKSTGYATVLAVLADLV